MAVQMTGEEMMIYMTVQTAAAFLAIFGFGIILDMPKKLLIYAGWSGAVGWLTYLLTLELTASTMAGVFYSSLAATVLSHVFARVLKAPVTVFLVAGIIPTVPGASIYRCVYNLIQGQNTISNLFLIQTVQLAGSMALGIFIVDSLFRLLKNKTA